MATHFPPPVAAPRRSRGGIVFPLLLIALGTIFLLQNLGLLTRDVWRSLVPLWPVLVIVFGADLIVRDRVSDLTRGLIVTGILVVGIGAVWLVGNRFATTPGPLERETIEQTLQGAQRATVELEYGAGRLTVGSLPRGQSDQLAALTFEGPRDLRPTATYRVRNGVGDLSYENRHDFRFGRMMGPGQFGSSIDLRLSPDVPTTLRVEAGASETRLDLSELMLSRLDVQAGASSVWVRLPARGITSARIEGGAASFMIEAPPGVALQVQHAGGLSAVDVDQNRFPAVGSQTYRSPDWDTATSKVDLKLEVGVASVTIR